MPPLLQVCKRGDTSTAQYKPLNYPDDITTPQPLTPHICIWHGMASADCL